MSKPASAAIDPHQTDTKKLKDNKQLADVKQALEPLHINPSFKGLHNKGRFDLTAYYHRATVTNEDHARLAKLEAELSLAMSTSEKSKLGEARYRYAAFIEKFSKGFALKWYKRAANNGNEQATLKVKELHELIDSLRKDMGSKTKEGIQYYREPFKKRATLIADLKYPGAIVYFTASAAKPQYDLNDTVDTIKDGVTPLLHIIITLVNLINYQSEPVDPLFENVFDSLLACPNIDIDIPVQVSKKTEQWHHGLNALCIALQNINRSTEHNKERQAQKDRLIIKLMIHGANPYYKIMDGYYAGWTPFILAEMRYSKAPEENIVAQLSSASKFISELPRLLMRSLTDQINIVQAVSITDGNLEQTNFLATDTINTERAGWTPLLKLVANTILCTSNMERDMIFLEPMLSHKALEIDNPYLGRANGTEEYFGLNALSIVIWYGLPENFASLKEQTMLKRRLVEQLIHYRSDVNYEVKTGKYIGKTPLHFAAKTGNLELCDILYKAGANIEATDNNGETPVFSAIQSLDIPTISFFIQKANLNHLTSHNFTLLHYCFALNYINALHCWPTQDNNLVLAKLLIRNGVKYNFRDNQTGLTVQHYVEEPQLFGLMFLQHLFGPIHFRPNERSEHHLIRSRFLQLLINAQNLMMLSSFSDQDAVQRCLDRGAFISERDSIYRTPLHNACAAGQTATASFLISKGARVLIEDEQGITPLHLSDENTCKAMLITTNGAFLFENNERQTAFSIAIRYNPRILDLLMHTLQSLMNISVAKTCYEQNLSTTHGLTSMLDIIQSYIFPKPRCETERRLYIRIVRNALQFSENRLPLNQHYNNFQSTMAATTIDTARIPVPITLRYSAVQASGKKKNRTKDDLDARMQTTHAKARNMFL